MACRTACCMRRRSGLPASPIASPIPRIRTVVAPTNEPKFTLAPWLSIASIHSANVSNWVTPAASPAACIIAGLDGAFVVDSPMISVVTPIVTFETTRPSPSPRKAKREWLWMSMKPGATTMPEASMRRTAAASERTPGGVTATMRSPRIPTSPGYHALPVPSTMRPPSMTTSNRSEPGPGPPGGAGRGAAAAVQAATARGAREASDLRMVRAPRGGS